jgi:hypothetical protein
MKRAAARSKKKRPVLLVDDANDPFFRQALDAALKGGRRGLQSIYRRAQRAFTKGAPDFNELEQRQTEIMLEAVFAKANRAVAERKRRLKRSGVQVDDETILDDELRLLAAKFIRAGLSFLSIKQIVDRAIERGRKTATDLFMSVGKAAAAARTNIKPLFDDELNFWLLILWDGTIERMPNKLPPLSRWSIPAAHKFFSNRGHKVELDALRKRYARLGLTPIQPFLVNTARAKVAVAQLPKSPARSCEHLDKN